MNAIVPKQILWRIKKTSKLNRSAYLVVWHVRHTLACFWLFVFGHARIICVTKVLFALR